jgi:hypothetical protein
MSLQANKFKGDSHGAPTTIQICGIGGVVLSVGREMKKKKMGIL